MFFWSILEPENLKWAYGLSKTVLYYIEEAPVVERTTLSPIKSNCGDPLQMEVNIQNDLGQTNCQAVAENFGYDKSV